MIDKNRVDELREPLTGFLRAWVKGNTAMEIDREAVIAMLKKVVPEEWENEEFARQYLETAIKVHTPVTELYGDLRPMYGLRCRPPCWLGRNQRQGRSGDLP